MKREAAIILGVLVPFAALLAAGLVLSRPGPPPPVATSSPPPLQVPPRAPRPGEGASTSSARAQGAADAGLVEDPPPPELEAPLRAVASEVRHCFLDQADRMHRAVQVRVGFRPLPDGGFEGAVVEGSTWQDPYLSACIEDVFEELGYTPDGRQTFTRATHTFVFDPARR